MEKGWRKDGGRMEEGWRMDGGRMEKGWRKDGEINCRIIARRVECMD